MLIYSSNILKFIDEVKKAIKEILAKEIGLKVYGERFYDKQMRFSYPIRVVIYNNKNSLGYFDADFYEIGLNECLIHNRKELYSVIRHELAHYITFILYGRVQAHGPEFRGFCKQMGWSEEVYKATTEISEIELSPILRRVQKLMALSSSGNSHEAELALIKSQQILLKHNIEAYCLEEGEKIYLKRIMKQKKENAKMRSIAKILETFFVSIVYNRAGDSTYLEISGNSVNIEIAEYVANFLCIEFDKLWKGVQKETLLKGVVAKNSFFIGVAKGYCNKIQSLKQEYNEAALMVLENKLMEAKTLVYPRLSYTKSSGNHCSKSLQIGEQKGKQLSIHPAVKNSTQILFLK